MPFEDLSWTLWPHSPLWVWVTVFLPPQTLIIVFLWAGYTKYDDDDNDVVEGCSLDILYDDEIDLILKSVKDNKYSI